MAVIEINPRFIYSDGGRSEAGYKGRAGDCVVRAICNAMDKDYKEVYKEIATRNKVIMGKKSVRHGTPKSVSREYLKEQGWVWCSAPKFKGRKARPADLPNGMVIAKQARHLVAVWNGIPLDTFDSSKKMVYGYWIKKSSTNNNNG